MRMKVLITGSRQATPVMLAKALEVVQWCQARGHAVIIVRMARIRLASTLSVSASA
jgi:hypothetical protein